MMTNTEIRRKLLEFCNSEVEQGRLEVFNVEEVHGTVAMVVLINDKTDELTKIMKTSLIDQIASMDIELDSNFAGAVSLAIKIGEELDMRSGDEYQLQVFTQTDDYIDFMNNKDRWSYITDGKVDEDNITNLRIGNNE